MTEDSVELDYIEFPALILFKNDIGPKGILRPVEMNCIFKFLLDILNEE